MHLPFSFFSQPRKTILNNLKDALALEISKEELAQQLSQVSIDPTLRPQNLSIESIQKIAEWFNLEEK